MPVHAGGRNLDEQFLRGPGLKAQPQHLGRTGRRDEDGVL
jgi:hypothetical protein